MQGIPGNLSLEHAEKWVSPRISARRLKHVQGVVKVSLELSPSFGCNPFLAQLAGWLHDCCKEMKGHELVEAARAYKIPLTPIEEAHGHLLHGPVAACVVKEDLGISNKDVLDAIAEHTLGAVAMCRLSELLFLADCLEESRPKEYTAPIWEALFPDEKESLERSAGQSSGSRKANVPQALLKASDLNLVHLIKTARPIHPQTVDVRNFYLDKVQSIKD